MHLERDRFVLGPDLDTDRYVVDRPVSLGGEGVVYRCRRGREQRAVKICRVAGSERERRRREWLEFLPGSDVPGLVKVHERFVGPPMHPAGFDARSSRFEYLVMEWIEGRTLTEVIRVGRPPHEVVAALSPIAEALDLLRSGRLTGGRAAVHGDVKPDNIMIRPDGTAVLVDLGLLRGVDVALIGAGSAGYCVPPQMSLHRQSDLYGLAGVVFHAFTRSHPPDDPTTFAAELEAIDAPPGVRRLIVAARTQIYEGGAVAWLTAVQGATERVTGRRRPQPALSALLIMVSSLMLTRAGGPVPPVDPVCDARRWAIAADRIQDVPLSWADSDGDCLHDAYEINAIGSDPVEADDNQAWLTTADAQLRYLVRIHELLRSEVWLDPAACRPDVWADAAATWLRSHPDAPPWADPDRDCLATVHEQVLGTDPDRPDTDADGVIDSLDPDSSNGLIEPLDIQLTLAGPVASQPSGQPPRLDRPRSDGSGD